MARHSPQGTMARAIAGAKVLKDILALASPRLLHALGEELGGKMRVPWTFRFPEPMTLSVTAFVGEAEDIDGVGVAPLTILKVRPCRPTVFVP